MTQSTTAASAHFCVLSRARRFGSSPLCRRGGFIVSAEFAWDDPLTCLQGVGPALAAKLARLDLLRVRDLLFHLPYRYQDRTRLVPVAELVDGQSALVSGRILGYRTLMRGRPSLRLDLADDTGELELRFFHFNRGQQAAFAGRARILCFGEARISGYGRQMVHPEYQLLDEGEPAPLADRLTPVYPLTEGLGQARIRALVDIALERLNDDGGWLQQGIPVEWLEEIDPELRHRGLAAALRDMHAPPAGDWEEATARRRLAVDELVAHQLAFLEMRSRYRRKPALPMAQRGELTKILPTKLPFTMTAAQQRVCAEIFQDLGAGAAMLRMVQGDVGSGKTLVAAMAAARAIENGSQVAIMAPTELLAAQHRASMARWLQPLGVRVGSLSGRDSLPQRRQTAQELADGSLQLVTGTHALFQESVSFARLGLIVIDEQHRFGVHQRLALLDKGATGSAQIHQLVMTATPIPRTLAMTAYADLDLSVIDQLPPGRSPVRTAVLSDQRRDRLIARLRGRLQAGDQAYWVCTLIEESDVLQCQAAEQSERLLAGLLPEFRVGLVHGRMKTEQKEAAMARFKAGEIHLLVATTVIEVGVDVPNATLMIIENAERLGLAQLHQLRGRVGRGEKESHCVLMYHSPLSSQARERLDIMRATNDGFLIAQKDLQLRGPGEVLGVRQTGAINFRVADLRGDAGYLAAARRVAERMFAAAHPDCRALVERWLPGSRQHYTHV
jgi:ATP-dependent DNA helicase RecG